MKIPLNQGWVTSRDEADLTPGELKVGTGCYYKPGDGIRAHKIWGRTAFGDTASAAKVKGLFIAGFDTADDKIVAYSGTALYSATAGATGTFSSICLSRLAAGLLALMLAGCFQAARLPDQPDAPETIGETPDPVRSRIVFTALQMVGVPYRYGGAAPDGFDCSGLVQYAYRNAGVNVPRTSREQLRASRPVGLGELTAGDLVFFQSRDNSHVGIYVGEGRFVHAPRSGRPVGEARIDEPYYAERWGGAGTFN